MKIQFLKIYTLICAGLFVSTTHAQSMSDITNAIDQWGMVVPGIACKTRTNNEASVRNLAHGVWNRDSSSLVALNCGWAAPYPWVSDVFANQARIDGAIWVGFVRSAGTAIASANETQCTVSVSGSGDSSQNPNGSGEIVGTMDKPFSPGFSGLVQDDEIVFEFVTTSGEQYPQSFNFFSMFCRLAQGVRIQTIDMDADSIGTF